MAGNANVTIKVHGSPAYAVIAFSYLLIIVYALTLAPVCWVSILQFNTLNDTFADHRLQVYAAEVWSLGTRGYGMGIAATGNWMFSEISHKGTTTPKSSSLTQHQTLPSACSSHQPSKTYRGRPLSYSVYFVSVQLFNSSSRIQRQAARAWKKLKRCSEMVDRNRGRRGSAIPNLTSVRLLLLRRNASSHCNQRVKIRSCAKMGRLTLWRKAA